MCLFLLSSSSHSTSFKFLVKTFLFLSSLLAWSLMIKSYEKCPKNIYSKADGRGAILSKKIGGENVHFVCGQQGTVVLFAGALFLALREKVQQCFLRDTSMHLVALANSFILALARSFTSLPFSGKPTFHALGHDI